ncbi:hypothetical protein O9992_23570 [Vibrio lentus]|nr:hypothetical protein [Vibrio lentus]
MVRYNGLSEEKQAMVDKAYYCGGTKRRMTTKSASTKRSMDKI